MENPKHAERSLHSFKTIKLQPVADYSIVTQCTHREKDLPQLPSTLEAQEMYQYTHKEPATVISQALIVSCKRRVDQRKRLLKPKVYRRTRTMLKIRCTDIRQTRHNYSQSTESEKAKFKLQLLPMQPETMSSTIL